MREDVLVSFIVPVYNVEMYIKKCLNSISSQQYRKIEIIVVNDGSPDNSAEIVDACASIDNRIKVIHKQNQGVSIARNVGIDTAKGDYIVFVDGDDYIDPDYTSYMLGLINHTKADIAVSLNNYSEQCKEQTDDESVTTYSPDRAVEAVYLNEIGVAVWNKIYKRTFLINNGIRFCKDFWFAEGMTFNIESFQVASKVAVGTRCVYYQRYNPLSAVRKFNIESYYCGIRALEYQRDLWKRHSECVEKSWRYHYWNVHMSIIKGIIETNTKKQYLKDYRKCVKVIRENISAVLNANVSLKWKAAYSISYFSPSAGAKLLIWKTGKI